MTAQVDIVSIAAQNLLHLTSDVTTGFRRESMTIADAREQVWQAIRDEAAGDPEASQAYAALIDAWKGLGNHTAALTAWCVEQAALVDGRTPGHEGTAMGPITHSDDAQSTGHESLGDALGEVGRDVVHRLMAPPREADERSCPGCGCTDTNACQPGGCWWVNHPHYGLVCSECVRRLAALTAADDTRPRDPYRALVVTAVELAAGASRWTPAEAAGYLERLIAAGSHVRKVQVISGQDGKVVAFQDGHGGADLPWRGDWGGPEKDSDVDRFLDGQVTGLNDRRVTSPTSGLRGTIPATTAAAPVGAETTRKKANGWCSRCGVRYGDDSQPMCECAGDPPVDRTGDEWTAYQARVESLHHRPAVATPTSTTPSTPVNPAYTDTALRPSADELVDSETTSVCGTCNGPIRVDDIAGDYPTWVHTTNLPPDTPEHIASPAEDDDEPDVQDRDDTPSEAYPPSPVNYDDQPPF